MQARIKTLEIEIARHRALYYGPSGPEIADSTYDALEAELRALDPGNAIFETVGTPEATGTKIRHVVFMGSQEKATTLQELEKWLVGKPAEMFLSEKMDGTSCCLEYAAGVLKQAVSRGDGEVGTDITAGVKLIPSVPKQLPHEFTGRIRGEVYMPLTAYEQHFSHMENARNAVPGMLLHAHDTCQHLGFKAYELYGFEGFEQTKFAALQKLRFDVPRHAAVTSFNQITGIYHDYLNGERADLGYLIDGLVISLNDRSLYEDYGIVSGCPKYSVALKFPPEQAETTVLGFDWGLSRNGRLTPVMLVKPVTLTGVTVRRVTMNNVDFLVKAGAGVGARVILERGGDVIPHFVDLAEGSPVWGPLVVPKTCPKCETPTTRDGKQLVCPNEDCGCRAFGRILHYTQVLDVLQVGEGLITALVDLGHLQDPADLYTLTFEQFDQVERRGRKHYDKMMANLAATKSPPLAKFLKALGIHGAGVSLWTALMLHHKVTTLAEIQALPLEAYLATPGIGDERAVTMLSGLQQRQPLITKLLAAGVTIKTASTDALKGLSFCFTGKASRPRKELEQLVVDAGGVVSSSVKTGLSYLVTDDPTSTTGKSAKARALGTRTITELEFMALLG